MIKYTYTKRPGAASLTKSFATLPDFFEYLRETALGTYEDLQGFCVVRVSLPLQQSVLYRGKLSTLLDSAGMYV